MKQYYESEVLFQLMEREGFNIPSSVPPYESEIKAYLINQVKQAYPKLTDYEAEWLLYNYTKHLPAEFPIRSVSDVTEATFENVVPFAYQSAILKGSTKYRDIDTGDILDTFDETKNLELVSVKMPVLTTSNTVELLKSNNFPLIGIGSSNKHSFLLSKTVDVITLFANLKTVSAYNPDANISFIFKLDDVVKKTVYQKLTPLGITSDIKIIVTGISFNLVEIMVPPATTLDINTMNVFHGEFNEKPLIKSNILTVNEDVVLRGIGDVQDTLDCLTGELTQRIEEHVLDGTTNNASRDWNICWNDYSTNTLTFEGYRPTKKLINTNSSTTTTIPKNFICDKVKVLGFGSMWQNGQTVDRELSITTYTGGQLIFVIEKSKLTTMDVSGFKQWLSQNPVTIQYELETPVVKTVDLTTVNEKGETTYFMPLEGSMNVQSSGEIIQPTFDMSVPVEATTQNLASFIDLEMEE